MLAYVVSYFYPDGSYAGIVGARYNKKDAKDLVSTYQLSYSDCTFITTEVEVE